MTVIVTGAGGFIGAALVGALVDRGHEVHGVVRPGGSRDRLDGRAGRAEVHEVDLTEPRPLRDLVRSTEPTVVVHAASRGGHASTAEAERLLWHDNLMGTVSLLGALEDAPLTRFLHIGSSLEYRPSPRPISETDPCEPVSARGASKLAATVAVREWAQRHDVEWTVVRPFRVYGPGEQSNRLTPTLIRAALAQEPIRLVSGVTRRDHIYIDDVVEGCLRAISVPEAAGEILNLGSGIEQSVTDVVDCVERITSTQVIRDEAPYPRSKHDAEHWVADMSHAARVLDWMPSIDLEHGLIRMIEEVRA